MLPASTLSVGSRRRVPRRRQAAQQCSYAEQMRPGLIIGITALFALDQRGFGYVTPKYAEVVTGWRNLANTPKTRRPFARAGGADADRGPPSSLHDPWHRPTLKYPRGIRELGVLVLVWLEFLSGRSSRDCPAPWSGDPHLLDSRHRPGRGRRNPRLRLAELDQWQTRALSRQRHPRSS